MYLDDIIGNIDKKSENIPEINIEDNADMDVSKGKESELFAYDKGFYERFGGKVNGNKA